MGSGANARWGAIVIDEAVPGGTTQTGVIAIARSRREAIRRARIEWQQAYGSTKPCTVMVQFGGAPWLTAPRAPRT